MGDSSGAETEQSQDATDSFAGRVVSAAKELEVTPQKQVNKRNASVGMGLSHSAAKSQRIDWTCPDCAKHFDSKILARIHKVKRCGEAAKYSDNTSATEVLLFANLKKYTNSAVRVVAYIVATAPIAQLDQNSYRFRHTLVDKDGDRIFAYRTIRKRGVHKRLAIQASVAEVSFEVAAQKNIYENLMRVMIIGPCNVRKSSFKSAHGQYNLSFGDNTTFHDMDEDTGDFSRMNPDPRFWGVPSNPLSAVDCNVSHFVNKQWYDVLGFVEMIKMADGVYKHTWSDREVTTARIYGRVMIFAGFGENQVVKLKNMRFTVFVELSPDKCAPYPVHKERGMNGFKKLRNKLVTMRAKFDDGIKGDANYGPSLQLDKGTEMVSSEHMKVKLLYRALLIRDINSSCVVAGPSQVVARQDKESGYQENDLHESDG